MKRFNSIITIIMSVIIIITILTSCTQKGTSTSVRVGEGKPVKVAVFLIDFKILLISTFL